MSEPSDPTRVLRIAVVGGGITGLAAAHRLIELGSAARRPIEVALFEAGPRLGGVIATERVDDLVIDAGPDSFLSEKPWALALCERIGLRDQLIGTRDELRRTYIAYAGRLHPLPDGFLLLAPTRFTPLLTSKLFSWPAKLRMGLELMLPRRHSMDDESLSAFVQRRLGRQVLERVAQPLIGGIYAADPEQLSLAATMPRFLDMERQHRSVIWAMWRQQRQAAAATATSGARWSLFLSFRRGMQTLVDHLAQRLPEGVLRLGTPIASLHADPAGGWHVGNAGHWDALVIATPAHAAARLVADTAPALATELNAISYASTATVTLAYRRDDIPHPLNGFGFVVPAVERRGIMACTFSNLKYADRAPAELVLLRAFVGGALQPQLLEQDDAAMEMSVRSELRQLLHITAAPRLCFIARHPASMPQYHVGHPARRDRIVRHLTELRGLALAGNAYNGVGIPDCIHSGESAAEAVFNAVTR